ncbi:hypothetical protein SteCoe_21455 [Stentor coeruleus]|uniref:Calmodulin n=1 Tax=Stentor coeruleus TaxID=5963 RepID=A0A1R2BPC3_9CILI|nr:hypothetical protein SteCoe_21455 [Stentor coeruleus]
MESLSEEQIQEINDVFDVIDENQNGSIDISELARGLRCLGLNPTNGEIKELMEKYDANDTKSLDREEFAHLFVECLSSFSTTEDLLRDQFKKLDTNEDGFITAEELRKLLLYGEEQLQEEEVDSIITEFDKNGDGRISMEEFLEGVLGKA